MLNLENTYLSKLPEPFYSKQSPVPVSNPTMLVFNETLAQDLGLDAKFTTAKILSGNETVKGTQPIAQAYAGHQFGHFSIL